MHDILKEINIQSMHWTFPVPSATMATLTHLRALHATIGSALDDIERVYNGHSVDFPSPDVPVIFKDSDADLAPGSAEALLKSDEVIKASSYIIAACGQLSTAVQNPFFALMEGVSGVRIRRLSLRYDMLT